MNSRQYSNNLKVLAVITHIGCADANHTLKVPATITHLECESAGQRTLNVPGLIMHLEDVGNSNASWRCGH